MEDWSSAIAFARQQPNLMRNKVVLWGTSFGGGHVIASAARDQKVAAAIAQCPFTDGIASALAMDLRSSLKVTAMAILDKLRGTVGMTPLMVATSGPPHSAALMTAPDAHGGYLALVPSEFSFRNHVAARFAVNILRYRPGRRAAKVSCPILFCICETDSVAPAGPTQRYAKKAPRGVVRLYRAGHFDIYVGEAFERVVADQLDFLKRHIPTERMNLVEI
ncbi:alpha/beta hydrolase [Mesorhizobium sp. 128a]